MDAIIRRNEQIRDKYAKAFSGIGGTVAAGTGFGPQAVAAGQVGVPGQIGAGFGADAYAGAAAGTAGAGQMGQPGQEEAAVAAIMIKKGKTDMKPEEIAKELNAMGIQATAQGKEIRFPSGKVIRDTDGDGNIGMKDKEFAAAIQQLSATCPECQQLLQMFQQKNPEKAAKLGINGAAGAAANPLGNYGGVLNNNAQAFGNPMQIKTMLQDVQKQFEDIGYFENSAENLYRTQQLVPVGQQLGVNVPKELAQVQPNVFGQAKNMFQMAMIPFVGQMM